MKALIVTTPNNAEKHTSNCEHSQKCAKYSMLWVEYVQEGLILYCHTVANVCGEKLWQLTECDG